VLLVDAGDTVRLDCQFAADSRFNLFDNPVWWRKAQRHEETNGLVVFVVLRSWSSSCKNGLACVTARLSLHR